MLIALSISIVFKALDTVLITQCCAISTVLIAMLQDNLRCFGVNYDMSRITRFLCYFLSRRLATVLSYYAFPSLPKITSLFDPSTTGVK